MYQQTSPHVAAEWQHLYFAALTESNHETQHRLIKQTEQAMGDRYHAARGSLDDEELRDMAEAVWNLLRLRREKPL
jgi:CRISPR/Cas system-associated protein Cas5 (RAMP superfamily)